jgi:mRNA-degrading endonuclease RelE of RelBE toxin-antitoxin system
VTEPGRYQLIIAPTARRQLSEALPESVAFAAYEFITGALLDHPHRVGKQVYAPLNDRYAARRGTYRVIYRIDDQRRVVTVVAIAARRDVYRPD